MPPINIAIIGSGGMAGRNAERFATTDGFRLSAVAARNPQTGPALAAKHSVSFVSDWQTLLDRSDIDAVAICTHNDSHGQIALAALDAHKHVFCEYPIARHLDDVKQLADKIGTSPCAIRVTHDEPLSAAHQVLKRETAQAGALMTSLFTRLTPGRGARPETLFNIPVSGPPAVFFVYHIFPFVDLFGPAAWVEAGAHYEGLTEEGRYDRFVNTLTVGFKRGGLGQWTWAGGIEIEKAEENRRIVMTGGTFIRASSGWHKSTARNTSELPSAPALSDTQQTRFLKDIQGDTAWRAVAHTAIDAVAIGLAAEQSIAQNRRIKMSE